jgi:peptidoglycan/LPS O-acetylase OafA/YrhL
MIGAIARRVLLISLYFGAISAVAGGVLGIAANGAGVPLTYLSGTPFTSYVIPGFILGLVIGGTQALAAIMVQRRSPSGPVAASVAGFGMIVWIFVELAVIGEYSPLQTIYFALGVIELALVLLLAGVVRRLA